MSNQEAVFATSRKADRRGSWRYGCGLSALVRLKIPQTGERPFAWVHDVSLTGISFDLLSPLEPGQEIDFQLRVGETSQLSLHAQVVHITALNGVHRIGCALAKPLTNPDLGKLLKQMRGEASRSE